MGTATSTEFIPPYCDKRDYCDSVVTSSERWIGEVELCRQSSSGILYWPGWRADLIAEMMLRSVPAHPVKSLYSYPIKIHSPSSAIDAISKLYPDIYKDFYPIVPCALALMSRVPAISHAEDAIRTFVVLYLLVCELQVEENMFSEFAAAMVLGTHIDYIQKHKLVLMTALDNTLTIDRELYANIVAAMNDF